MRALSSESLEYVANGKGGEGNPRRNFSSDKPSTDQMHILLSKVVFQEIPFMGTCIMNLREG